MSGRRCAHVHPSGKACGGYAVAGGDRCFAHDAGQAAARDEARRRGGRAGRPAALPRSDAPVRSLDDVVALIEATINDVRSGRLDVKLGNCVGYLANVALKAIAQADLEARLAALEAVLEPGRREAVALQIGGPR